MAKIQLTPAELLAQSTEMASLRDEYASLLNVTNATLTSVNANWSAVLANNFQGKMTKTKTGCDRLVACLDTGASLAKTSAKSYQSMDEQLAKVFGNLPGNSDVNKYFDQVSEQIKTNTSKSNTSKSTNKSSSSGKSTKSKEEKSWWDKLKDTVEDVTSGVKSGVAKAVDLAADGVECIWEGAQTIGNAIGDGISWVADKYEEKGTLYKVVKTGSAVVSVIGSCAAVVASWGAAAGTGGLGTGLAVTSTIYGANTIANSFADIYNCWFGDVEQVGDVNLLKTGLRTAGEAIGGEIGGDIASTIYTAGSMVATVNNLTCLAGKAIQSGNVVNTFKNAASEVKAGASGMMDIVLHSDVTEIAKDVKLLSYEIPNLVKATGMIETGKKIVESVWKLDESLGKVVGEFAENFQTGDNIVESTVKALGLEDVQTVMNVVETGQKIVKSFTEDIGKIENAWNGIWV